MNPPLVSLGQGDYRHDLHPRNLGVPRPPRDALDLRFLHREPAEVYHAQAERFLGSHALRQFRQCPALFCKHELGLAAERDSTAYAIGRAAHTLILEGRSQYEREYIVGGPINPKTNQPFGTQTKAFAEWAARQAKPILSDAQAALVEQLASAVNGHARARALFADGVAEGVVRTDYRGVACQARLDWVHPARGVVDLKTAKSLDEFERVARSCGYVHQVAFYRALVQLLTGEVCDVHIVAVEKCEPFRVGVWRVAPVALAQAQAENDAALDELRRCRATDYWPTRFEAVRTLDAL